MQILFNYSAEGNTKCLGIFDENIDPFSKSNLLKVPQMGWNKVEFSDAKLKKLNDYYYFANSFYAKTFNSTKAMSEYGIAFSSVVQKDNFLGCQFHPEKSGEAGVKFLKYFTDIKIDEIESIKNKNINELKILLANKTTSMLHGKQQALSSERTAKEAFSENSSGLGELGFP